MPATVAVIAQGEMGSGIGKRLSERGARVLTSLAGRSAASAERAKAAGMEAIEDDGRLVGQADFLFSVIPPGEAVAFARRFAGPLGMSAKKPIFVECNAISPARVREVAAIIAPTGAAFVDSGIIGGPPTAVRSPARIYVAGPAAAQVLVLRDYGLDIRVVKGEIGAASALKCSYAALTKGTQALGIALMLGAMRAGVAPELRREFAESQPALSGFLARQLPSMYRKAYRWAAEMEEIGDHLGAAEPSARAIYRGMAPLYEHLAEGDKIALLDAFLERTPAD